MRKAVKRQGNLVRVFLRVVLFMRESERLSNLVQRLFHSTSPLSQLSKHSISDPFIVTHVHAQDPRKKELII